MSMENSKRGVQVQGFEVKIQEDINSVLEGQRRPLSSNNTDIMHSTVGRVALALKEVQDIHVRAALSTPKTQ